MPRKNKTGGRPQGPKPLYKTKPGRAALPHHPDQTADQQASPANNAHDSLASGTPIAPTHFELRDDGSIVPAPHPVPLPQGEGNPVPAPGKTVTHSVRQTAVKHSPSPGGVLSHLGNDERSSAESRKPSGPSERERESQRRDEGGQSPKLTFTDPDRKLWLYQGNCLELLDAIAAKYPEGRFDAIFADPPYFLSNGGITCHAGSHISSVFN